MSATAVTARGLEVPKIGFGTRRILGRECEEAVRDALDIGYRHVDTAAIYDKVALRWLVDQRASRRCPRPRATSAAWRTSKSGTSSCRMKSARALPKGRRDFDPSWAPDWDS